MSGPKPERALGIVHPRRLGAVSTSQVRQVQCVLLACPPGLPFGTPVPAGSVGSVRGCIHASRRTGWSRLSGTPVWDSRPGQPSGSYDASCSSIRCCILRPCRCVLASMGSVGSLHPLVHASEGSMDLGRECRRIHGFRGYVSLIVAYVFDRSALPCLTRGFVATRLVRRRFQSPHLSQEAPGLEVYQR